MRLGRNTASQFAAFTFVAGPAFCSMLSGTIRLLFSFSVLIVRGGYCATRFVYRGMEFAILLLSAERCSRDMRRYANELSILIDRLSARIEGPQREWLLEALEESRSRAQGMTSSWLRRVASVHVSSWGYVDVCVERLRSSLVRPVVQPLHEVLDELEVLACQSEGNESRYLAKEIRRARNKMIARAYSIVGADVSREGDRNARVMTIMRNAAVWLTVLMLAGWWVAT